MKPTVPQSAEGTRIDPPVSLPSASVTCCEASATAEPPLDPPEMRSRAHGLWVVPIDSLTDVIPHAHSWVWVLPTRTAPARRARLSASASATGTWFAHMREPYVVRTPSESNRSFTPRGTPASAPWG